MKNFIERLRKLAEFDEAAAKDFADKTFGRHHDGIIAAKAQYLRQKALTSALVECAEALLDNELCSMEYYVNSRLQGWENRATNNFKALIAVQALIPREFEDLTEEERKAPTNPRSR